MHSLTPYLCKQPCRGLYYHRFLFSWIGVSGRPRMRQEGIICQRERGSVCCGRMLEEQNEKKAMTTVRDPIAAIVRRESLREGFRSFYAPLYLSKTLHVIAPYKNHNRWMEPVKPPSNTCIKREDNHRPVAGDTA